MKEAICTQQAPQAIGIYSQAIKVGNTVYISGQIPLEPESMMLVPGGIKAQVQQTFKNLHAVCVTAGGSLADIVKLTIYLTDLDDFPIINEVMSAYFQPPYPARVTLEVSALPKHALVEIDAVMIME